MVIRLSKEDAFKQCVYKITFGEKIYVGCTTLFKKRMRTHQYLINSYPSPELLPKEYAYYYNIIEHVNIYALTDAFAEVLQEVPAVATGNKEKLIKIEEYYIKTLSRTEYLLNSTEFQYFTPREITWLSKGIENGSFSADTPLRVYFSQFTNKSREIGHCV